MIEEAETKAAEIVVTVNENIDTIVVIDLPLSEGNSNSIAFVMDTYSTAQNDYDTVSNTINSLTDVTTVSPDFNIVTQT
jgi:hypothetical protein